jgi:hypothetical protein
MPCCGHCPWGEVGLWKLKIHGGVFEVLWGLKEVHIAALELRKLWRGTRIADSVLRKGTRISYFMHKSTRIAYVKGLE